MFGKVVQFDNAKRYGFIVGDDGTRFYFRASDVKTPSGYMEKGSSVEFQASTNDRGYAAVNVRPL